jgi:hypothetical protein
LHGLEYGILNEFTLRKCVTRKNVFGIASTRISHLSEIEPNIVEYSLRLAKMGNALNKDQVMIFSTDLIHGTKYSRLLLNYKKILWLPSLYKKCINNNQTKKMSW